LWPKPVAKSISPNAELHEAMMPANGLAERFVVESTGDGVWVSIKDS
jgi:hypothetical protein